MHNIIYSFLFSIKLLNIAILLILFYFYFKKILIKISPLIANKTNLVNIYPYSQAVGTIELMMISIIHIIYCIILTFILNIKISSNLLNTNLSDCIYGGLIGIGSVGTSILLCTISMRLVEVYKPDISPRSLNEWLAVSNAGWIRHHKQLIKSLPLYVAIIIIICQVGSEETIFRSILIQYFTSYGNFIAFFFPTLLFVLMQIFHMPNMLSAMFPVIGASVMGITHSLLYQHHPSVTPLIISHVTFFLFTIL
jgi:membrane protease YdiL (CAAX protease family)